MQADKQFASSDASGLLNTPFMQHEYGRQVHILNDQCLHQFLLKLGHIETEQPQLNFYVQSIYETLLAIRN